MKPRTCIRCARTYREVDNYGAWSCPAYHPSPSLSPYRPHACCRRPRGSPGCVAADHTDTADVDRAIGDAELRIEVTSEDALLMASLAHVSLSAIKRPSWTLDASGVWRVARCDVGARGRALARAANEP